MRAEIPARRPEPYGHFPLSSTVPAPVPGLEPFGAHRLRHNLACQMVVAGVPVPAIGAVLRHRSVTSTANYARVDVERLREVALPWPSGAL